MTPESLDGADPPTVASRKAKVREAMRRWRDSIPPAERARLAVSIQDRLFRLPELETARTILLFSSFGSEVPTGAMAGRVLSTGKRLLLPYLEDDRVMETAELRPGQRLAPGRRGPREPEHRVPVDPSDIDAAVVPGLAFDRRGYRLGYGGGHYDRYLARLGPGAVRVGVAFSLQMVERLPVTATDERVHLVVTDEEVLDMRPVQ